MSASAYEKDQEKGQGDLKNEDTNSINDNIISGYAGGAS